MSTLQGLDTYTRLGAGIGFGWSNQFDSTAAVFYYSSMSSANQALIELNNKIKMQVKVYSGNNVTTAGYSCRLLIRKIT